MKAKDIVPGEVYALWNGTDGLPAPVVFLAPLVKANKFRERYHGVRRDPQPFYERDSEPGYRASGAGYPVAAVGYWERPRGTQRDQAQILAALRSVTLAGFEAATVPNDPALGINYELVKFLGRVWGTYADARSAYEQREREREEARARHEVQLQALAQERQARDERARAHGVGIGYPAHSGYQLSVAQLDAILDLLDEQATELMALRQERSELAGH